MRRISQWKIVGVIVGLPAAVFVSAIAGLQPALPIAVLENAVVIAIGFTLPVMVAAAFRLDQWVCLSTPRGSMSCIDGAQ